MANIKVNAALQRIAILEKEGYVSRAVTYSKISGDEVLEFASMNSGINQGQLSAAMHAIVQEFRNPLLTCHSVELPGVGIFRVGVNSKMVEAPEDVSVNNITRRKIYFLPSTNIKSLLSRVSFTTTGNEDEEDEGASPNSSQGGTSSDSSEGGENGQQSGGSGSGNSQSSLTAPSISGTTPFAESTSVTMSGPDGAEIRYTTDGSTPTSSSSLYSSALSLSATTTVKAIAIKDGQSSEVTTKVFTKSSGSGDAD